MSRALFSFFFICLISITYSEFPFTYINTEAKFKEVDEKKQILSTKQIDDTFLVAYKDGEKNFLSGLNNRIEIPFAGFSDVFVIDSKYHFCPITGKYLYDATKDSTKLGQFEDTILSYKEDFTIKCFHLEISNIHFIFVGLINYKKGRQLFSYKYIKESGRWISKEFSGNNNKSGEIAKDILMKNIDGTNYIFVFSKTESGEGILRCYQYSYSNENHNLEEKFVFNNFNKDELGHSVVRIELHEKKLLFLSYTPNEINYVSFYLDIGQKPGDSQNKSEDFNYLPVVLYGDDYTIDSIEFFKGDAYTRYAYYTLTSKVNSSLKYFGIIDVLDNVVLYSSNKEGAVNLSLYNKNKNNLLFGYSTKNSFSYTCPFFDDDECQDTCSKSKILINLIKNNTCNTNLRCIFDRYSFRSQCPVGYHLNTKIYECERCPEYYKYKKCNTTSCTCDSVCDTSTGEYFQRGKLCLNWFELGYSLYIGKERTIENISYKNGTFILPEKCPENAENKNRTCTVCQDIGKVLSDKECIDECPSMSEPDENGICKKCESFYQADSKKCVSECRAGSVVEDFNCLWCGNTGEYFYKDTCEKKCPEWAEIDNENYLCKECEGDKSFFQEASCVKECAPGYTIEDATDKKHKICKKCDDVIYLGECIKTCPSGSSYDEETKICTVCKDKNPSEYLFNGKCVEECPVGSVDKDNECILCKDENKYYYNKKCYDYETGCPEFTLLGADNICSSCFGKGYFYNKECRETCPKYTFSKTDEENKVTYCEVCSGEKSKFYKEECVKECPENVKSWTTEENIEACTDCSTTEEKYFFNNECIAKCPSYTKVEGFLCIDNSCKFECMNGAECNPETNKCICGDGYSGLYCEINNLTKEKSFFIYPVDGTILRTKVNLIAFDSTEVTVTDTYDIEWKVTDTSSNEEINDENYLNGKKDMLLKLAPNTFNKIAKSRITLTITNKDTNEKIVNYIEVSFSSIDINLFDMIFSFKQPNQENGIAMKEEVTFTVTLKNKLRRLRTIYDTLSYIFSFVDENGNEIPLEENKIEGASYTGVLPYTGSVSVSIIDAKGQVFKIFKKINITKNNEYSKTLNDVIQESYDSQLKKLIEIYNCISHSSKSYDKNDLVELIKVMKESKDHVKISLSILERLINNDQLNDYSTANEILTDLIQLKKTITTEEEGTLNLFYKIIEEILQKLTQNKEKNDISKDVGITQENIKKINNLLITSLVQGEKLQIQSSDFNVYIGKPGRTSSKISVEEEDLINKNRKNLLLRRNTEVTKNEDDCTESIFCVSPSVYSSIKNYFLLTGDSSNITVAVTKMTNTEDGSSYKKMTSSHIIPVFYYENHTEIKTPFAYSISLDIDPKYEIKEVNSDSACVPLQDVKNAKNYCKTYFNYNTNKAICKCAIRSEISGVYDSSLAAFYKTLQFPSLEKDYLNPLSVSFISCTFLIVIIFSIILLFIDCFDDKSEIALLKMSETEKMQKEMEVIKPMKDANIISYAWFITQNYFPFFEIINLYDYRHPRYIRFMVQMIAMLIALLFSILPFYKSSFSYKEDFINGRDIEKESWDVDNLPVNKKDVVYSVLYCIVSSITIYIVGGLFSFLLYFRDLPSKKWRSRKTALQEYISKNLGNYKNTQTEKVKNKLIALCEFINLYQTVKNKNPDSNGDLSLSPSLSHNPNFIIRGGKKKNKKFQLNSYLDLFPEGEGEPQKKKLHIERGGQIELNTPMQEKDKKNERVNQKRLEINGRLDFKYDYSSAMRKRPVKRDQNDGGYYSLKIDANGNNYSFFNLLPNSEEENEKAKEKRMILRMSVASVGMFVLLILIYFLFYLILADVYLKYKFYIVKVWLVPSVVILTILRLVVSYIFSFLCVLVFLCYYHKRNKTQLGKILFEYVIPEYLTLIYEVKLIVDKDYDIIKKDLELKSSKK